MADTISRTKSKRSHWGLDARNADIVRRRALGEWPHEIAKATGLRRSVVSGVLFRSGLTNLPGAGKRPAGPPLIGADWPTRCAGAIEYDTNGGCWLWARRTDRNGYGVFLAGGRRSRGGRQLLVHRTSYEHHHGPIPAGLVVRHRCDVPTCCNPDHLLVGTHADNMADREARNRTWRKLSAAQVAAIRERRDVPAKVFAADFGVSQSLVFGIRAGTKHLTSEPTPADREGVMV